ncbi:MAG: hypothetical protein K9L56_13055 [Clostridiales bacterium]|nr:hypothetical protein [Clostridiales bacterium]
MRKIREILRLKWELGMGNRKVARSCSISHSTVRDLVKRERRPGYPGPCPKNWMMLHCNLCSMCNHSSLFQKL